MDANTASAVSTPGPPVGTSTFLGARIHLLTSRSLLDLVAQCIVARRKVVIANHNLHSLCLYSSSSKDAAIFRTFYHDADYTVADGISVIVLARLQGQQISYQHRVAYNDWLPFMLPVAARKAWRVFYLGSAREVSIKAADILRARFPGLYFRTHHGYFNAQFDSEPNKQVLAIIRDYRPHILFVGMGMPRQEQWIQENRSEIEANVILTSGATLDYIAGAKRMAPRWMGAIGLEWAFRLATEPRRLAHRYLVEPWGLVRAVVRNDLPVAEGSAASIYSHGAN